MVAPLGTSQKVGLLAYNAPKLAVYTTYILPILRGYMLPSPPFAVEPETIIECQHAATTDVFQSNQSRNESPESFEVSRLQTPPVL